MDVYIHVYVRVYMHVYTYMNSVYPAPYLVSLHLMYF